VPTLWDCRAASQPWNFHRSNALLACQVALARLSCTQQLSVRPPRCRFSMLSPLLHLYLPFISSGCCGPHRARSSWRSLEIFIVGERTRFLFNNDHSQHDERSMELLPSESPSSYTIYSSSALRCLQAYVHTTYALNTSSRNNSPQSNSHARAHRLS
jgi:hypothetical protein